MPACMILLSEATVRRWFTLTCVDRTRFMLSKSFSGPFGAAVGSALQPAAVEEDRRYFALRIYQLDLVPARFEDRHGVGREARLHPQLVRQPLVVKARPIDGLLDIHLEIENVKHGLEDRVDDGRPSRRAEREIELAAPQDD